MTKLALIRHGHTDWNRAGRIQGRTDIPLDEGARVELQGYKLPNAWADADLISSPLLRAQQTAEIISGRAPTLNDSLIEMNWGDWEGRIRAELAETLGDAFRENEARGLDFTPPNGESPRMVQELSLIHI